MTERRAHWSDALIDNVADTLGVCVVSMMTVPDDIYEVIAAVEDWGSWPKFKLLDLVLARQRADKAEAQIQAVRDVIRDHRSIIGDPGVSAIQQALEGGQR